MANRPNEKWAADITTMQPVWRSGLSAPTDQLRYPGLDEPSRQLLGLAALKLMCGRLYQNRQDARTEIFAYFEGFYNRTRRHFQVALSQGRGVQTMGGSVNQRVH